MYEKILNKLRSEDAKLLSEYIKTEKLRDTFLQDMDQLVSASRHLPYWEVCLYDSHHHYPYYDWKYPGNHRRGITLSYSIGHDLGRRYDLIFHDYKDQIGKILKKHFKEANGLDLRYSPEDFNIYLYYKTPIQDYNLYYEVFTSTELLDLAKRIETEHNEDTVNKLKILIGEKVIKDGEKVIKGEEKPKQKTPQNKVCDKFVKSLCTIINKGKGFELIVNEKESGPSKAFLVYRNIPFTKELKDTPLYNITSQVQHMLNINLNEYNQNDVKTPRINLEIEGDTLSMQLYLL
jgi:hypothetical protein